MAYCPECDEIREDGRFCPECGSELVESAEEAESTDPVTASDSTDTDSAAIQTDYFEQDMIEFLFKYPLARGKTVVAYWAILVLFGFLIIPAIILYGYAYRIGRSAATKQPLPPQFTDWIGLLKDGLLLIVAILPAMIAVVIVSLIPLILGVALDSAGLAALALPVYLVGIYFAVATIPTFLATGSVSATYSGGRFLSIAMTKTYLKSVVFIILTLIGLQIIFGIILVVLMLTIIGPFIFMLVAGPFLIFVPHMMFGRYYAEAAEAGQLPAVADTDRIPARF